MKAITLEQPFASLVCIGAQKMETRPWHTEYRGPLAIHTGESFSPVIDPYYRSLLSEAGLDSDKLPHGKVVAIACLSACKKIITSEIPCYPEFAFSDFTPGSYVFELSDIKRLVTPIAAKGYALLWDWEEDSEDLLFMDSKPIAM